MPDLTPTEKKVMALIGKGFSNSAIAEALDMRSATVRAHLNTLYQKFYLKKDHGIRQATCLALIANGIELETA